MFTQDEVKSNLIKFLIDNNVEIVMVNDRVTIRRFNPDLTTADVSIDVADWIYEE